jgi:hypothetical protein
MSPIAWILLWAVVLLVAAYFVVREVRSGRKEPADFDRLEHEAVREASRNRDIRGPNTFGGWGS